MNTETFRQTFSQAAAGLHPVRDMLLEAKANARGAHRRRIQDVEDAVMDAIGAAARQGLSGEEVRAVRKAYLEAELADVMR